MLTALTCCPPPPPESPPSGTPAQAAPGDRRDGGASSQTQGGAGRSPRRGHQTGCRWPFTVRPVTAAWCPEGGLGDGFRHHTRSGSTGRGAHRPRAHRGTSGAEMTGDGSSSRGSSLSDLLHARRVFLTWEQTPRAGRKGRGARGVSRFGLRVFRRASNSAGWAQGSRRFSTSAVHRSHHEECPGKNIPRSVQSTWR